MPIEIEHGEVVPDVLSIIEDHIRKYEAEIVVRRKIIEALKKEVDRVRNN